MDGENDVPLATLFIVDMLTPSRGLRTRLACSETEFGI